MFKIILTENPLECNLALRLNFKLVLFMYYTVIHMPYATAPPALRQGSNMGPVKTTF